MPGRKIIVAVDDSPCSKELINDTVAKLCHADDEVHLVSVLEPSSRPDFVAAAESSYPVESTECKPDPIQLEKRCKMLKDYQSTLNDAGAKDVKLTTLVSCIGGSSDLARHICEYAADSKADMLVMGSRGMGSAQRAVMRVFGLGSVSDYVVRHAQVPNVLVHRGKPAA